MIDLNGYATESYVSTAIGNQHDFGTITVGSTNLEAASASDTVTFASGNNVVLTPNSATNTITVSITDVATLDGNGKISNLQLDILGSDV